MTEVVDSCSLASPASVCRTKHLHLHCSVDFTRRALTGTAALTVQSQEDNLRSLVWWDAHPVPAASSPPASRPSPGCSPSQTRTPVCSALSWCLSGSSPSAPFPLSRSSPSPLSCLHRFPHPLRILRFLLPPAPGHILVPHPRCVPHPALRFHFSTNPRTLRILVPRPNFPCGFPIFSAWSPELPPRAPEFFQSPGLLSQSTLSSECQTQVLQLPDPTLPFHSPLLQPLGLQLLPSVSLPVVPKPLRIPSTRPLSSPRFDTSSLC